MVVYNVDKGKQPIRDEEKKMSPVNPNPQPKMVLCGNDRPRPVLGQEDRSRQTAGRNGNRPFVTLKERMNKEYTFRRDCVAKLFKEAVRRGLQLPECRTPEEKGQTSNPNYCPYHQVISHPIEDCYVFKDWLEEKCQHGEFNLSDKVLNHPRKESTRVITSSPILDKGKGQVTHDEQWETVVSKKTIKMLKQLEHVPGIKWKSPLEPVIKLRKRPSDDASISGSSAKIRPKKHKKLSQRGRQTTHILPTISRRQDKHKRQKKKKSVTQKIINNLDEYHQPARRPVLLAEFMSKLQIDNKEEENEKSLPVETCRVIFAASCIFRQAVAQNAGKARGIVNSVRYNNRSKIRKIVLMKDDKAKQNHESCLMVLHTCNDSDEDLCFPSENESEPIMHAQEQPVLLGNDSEHSSESSADADCDSEKSSTSEDLKSKINKVAQIQLRSGKVLPHVQKKAGLNEHKGKKIMVNEDMIPKDS